MNILRLPEVLKRTGLTRSTLYDLIKQGKFPRAIQLSIRCVGWLEDEVHDWVVKRLEAARAG